MNMRFQKVLMTAVVIGLYATSSALAAPSYLDGSAKARGDYGQMSRGRSGMMYQNTSPSVQRSFSYEPSQNAIASQKSDSKKSSDSAKSETKKPDSSGAMAQRETRTYRSFSYEPGTAGGTMRGRSGSTPLWALPKTDSRKYGGQ